MRNFAELGALRVVTDERAEVAEHFAEQHGAQTASWRQVLDDDAIEGVVVAAPAVAHYHLSREALQAGKNVFVEKPFALRGAQATDLCQIAADRGLILMVGHLLQYHPAFRRLKQLASKAKRHSNYLMNSVILLSLFLLYF